MSVSTTEAKQRFDQLLTQAQRGPVFIDESGRRHSVLLSARAYDQLLAGQHRLAVEAPAARDGAQAQDFYSRYRDWVDMNNELVERHGVFGEEHRLW
jgi:prevent-host-death family protein